MAIVGELLVSLAGDAKGWKKATSEAEQAIRKLAKEALIAGKDLEKFTLAQLRSAAKSKTAYGKAAKGMLESLAPVAVRLNEQGKLAGATAEEIGALSLKTVKATSASQQFVTTLNKVSSQLWVISMGLQQFGRALSVTLTAPLVGVGALAIKTFADIETATVNLATSLGIPVKRAKELSDSFGELSLVIPVSRRELLGIAYAAAEAGISAKHIETWVIAIGKAVTITKELKPEVLTEGLKKTMDAFGISQEQVERALSVIRKASKDTVGGMNEYMTALVNLSPAAKTLNLNFADTNALLMSLIPTQRTATRAGSRLNSIFIDMLRNLPKMAAQLGYTRDQLDEMISTDAVGVLKEYLDRLGLLGKTYEQIDRSITIFSQDALKALLPLFDETGKITEQQEKLNEEWETATTLNRDYKIAADTLANTFKSFRNVISEIVYLIGEDLNPIIGKFLETATRGIAVLIAIWQGMPPLLKKIVFGLSAILAIIGPMVLLLDKLFVAPIAGLVTFTAKTLKVAHILGIVKAAVTGGKAGILLLGAAFAKIVLIIGAVIGGLYLLYKVLDHFFDITKRIKGALGFEGLDERIQKITDRVNNNLKKIFTEGIKEAGDKASRYLGAMALNIEQWGDKIMERFLYGFREADFGILDDAMRIVESYFDVLEQQGKASVETIHRNTLEARRLIARAIYEVKELGEVSAETTRKLEALVGAARIESIAKQIMAALKVEEIEESIDKINDEIKARRRSLKRETAIIDKAIDERKGEYDDQIEEHEKVIKLLQKRKRDNQRQYKTELRALEDIVETAEGERDIARDRLDTIKESNDLFIENLQEQRDALRDNVDETRETLQELQDLRKEEVDTAEGMLDYARMNLEAARNQLKKEQALGRDEWDASFRAAESRTDAAQDQVDLAYATYIKTKKLYKEEEKVLKDELKIATKDLKLKDKDIREARRVARAEEKIVEEELDVAQDALKAARRALDNFRDSYKKQADLLSDEIDERRAMVADFKDARDEILNTLKKERDAINEKYQGEINILEDRLNIAQDALDKTRQIYAQERGINEQLLKMQAARLKAFEELGGEALPGGGLGFAGFSKELEEATTNYEDMLSGMEETTEEKAPTIGKALLAGIFPPYGLYLAAQEFFKSEKWEKIKEDIVKTVKDIDWAKIGKIVLGLLFPPYGLYIVLTDVFNIDWEKVKEDIVKFVEQIDWGKIGKTILGLIFPPYGLFLLLTDIFNIDWAKIGEQIGNLIASGVGAWEKFKEAIKNSLGGIWAGISEKWGEMWGWGKSVAENLASGISGAWNKFTETMKNVLGAVWNGIVAKWSEMWGWGKQIAENIASGITGAWGKFHEKAKQVLGAVWNGLIERWSEMWGWGKKIAENIASGIYGAWDKIKQAAGWIANVFKSFLGWFSPPKEGPMSEGDKWMPNMMKTLAEGMLSNIPTLERAASEVGESIAGISATQPVIGTRAIAGAQGAIQGVAAPAPAGAGAQPGISKQTIINLQPGMMIASKGEVRAFARMLGQVQETEAQRTGLKE